MIKKAFVSLFFVANRLEILKLNSSKKKAEVFATIDLPQGLIVNHEVKDTNALAEILKKLWKKLHIREKSVGIVVPEFSTFTKVLMLPKLEMSELDEAARWQSQEYMPIALDDMVLDWKIIGEKPSEYQVLVVAIKESVLAGYVNATALAGLFPLVVETPSISLARIANGDFAKVIIYALSDEIILTLTVGEKVLSSTVVSYEESSQVVPLISQMIRYNKEVKVEKIYIGGVGIQTDFLKEFCEKNQISVEKISLKMGGLSEEDSQRYLIPIALQFKDPAEPSSSATINLLPEPVVKKYERKRFNLQLWGLLMIVTFMVVISFVASLGTYMFFIQQISSKKSQVSVVTNTYSKNKDATVKIKSINDASNSVLAVLATTQQPAEIFNIIYKSKPEGVKITSYRIDYEKGGVTLSGVSATRDDLISFKQSLEKTGLFGQILLPLSAFEIENDLEFALSFVYTPPAK
jgi:Tfp pilus assembly protein PilN